MEEIRSALARQPKASLRTPEWFSPVGAARRKRLCQTFEPVGFGESCVKAMLYCDHLLCFVAADVCLKIRRVLVCIGDIKASPHASLPAVSRIRYTQFAVRWAGFVSFSPSAVRLTLSWVQHRRTLFAFAGFDCKNLTETDHIEDLFEIGICAGQRDSASG